MPPSPTPNPLRLLVPVLVVVISLTVGGGLLARELYHPPAGRSQEPVTASTTSSLGPERQPGSSRVDLTTDAAAHPESEAVRRLLQAHFDAINERDYDAWTTTVVWSRIEAQPREEWLVNYRSTRDGSIVVHRIEAGPDERLNVLVAFTSVQDVADAPPDLPEPCIRWRLNLPLAREQGAWKLDTLPAGTTPERTPC
ncbi:hypothetical protein B0I33_104275 [Prauserella shujinwangii]|uniref:Uncharacterized protein n=1 Tax=Prauserella shujinwangii TaxID=1453103 RepID=A0A2T0LWW7_9PSEU|nr:hypothetical protein [Prauserella shujinwangii]PRX48459.1 hypothetical protein B0I33_104275 [Prauserella shujinwangii]